MAPQWHPCWTRRCLVLFSFSLFLSMLHRPLGSHAAPAVTYPAGRPLLESRQVGDAHAQEHSIRSLENAPERELEHQRRDVIQDVLDDPDVDTSTSGSSATDDVHPKSRVLPQQPMIASTLCNSEASQSLGPDWNGSFASNSPDGIYPSQIRSCSWTIQAVSGDNNGRSMPYVIAINFTTPIQLVCG